MGGGAVAERELCPLAGGKSVAVDVRIQIADRARQLQCRSGAEGLLELSTAVASLDGIGREVEEAVGVSRILLTRQVDLLVGAPGVKEHERRCRRCAGASIAGLEIPDMLRIERPVLVCQVGMLIDAAGAKAARYRCKSRAPVIDAV